MQRGREEATRKARENGEQNRHKAREREGAYSFQSDRVCLAVEGRCLVFELEGDRKVRSGFLLGLDRFVRFTPVARPRPRAESCCEWLLAVAGPPVRI